MNILFLTMSNFSNIEEHGIYTDLIRCFAKHGNNVTVLLPSEKKNGKDTYVETIGNIKLIRVKTGNLFNVNMFTKLISRAGISYKYIRTIKKYNKFDKIDLVLYSTPPTTFNKVVNYVKKVFNAKSYLMLKDIFPQNAVDLGMISQNGLIFNFLRIGEKKLYKCSDYIGCMSKANVEYLLRQDSWIDRKKVEICPNALDKIKSEVDKNIIKKKYDIPTDKIIFIYGGSFGNAQGIDFLIDCIKKYNGNSAFFLICGDGPFFGQLKNLECEKRDVMKVIKWLPANEYSKLVCSSDVGLVFLNYKFNIPNYPSRLLSYMEYGLPILAATDKNTDIGKNAYENGYGDWVESKPGNTEEFLFKINKFCEMDFRNNLSINSMNYFMKNYTVEEVYNIIFKHFD